MRIKLNDKEYEIAENTTLADFLMMEEIRPEGIAIAIGYQVIPKSQWRETVLTDGIELMLIQAVSGG